MRQSSDVLEIRLSFAIGGSSAQMQKSCNTNDTVFFGKSQYILQKSPDLGCRFIVWFFGNFVEIYQRNGVEASLDTVYGAAVCIFGIIMQPFLIGYTFTGRGRIQSADRIQTQDTEAEHPAETKETAAGKHKRDTCTKKREKESIPSAKSK